MTTPWFESIAAFDLETTGVDPSTARVVSACVAELDSDGSVVWSREWLVNPGVEIPAAAASVHGITTERARAEGLQPGPAITEIVATITELLDRGIGLTVFNAAYDIEVLWHDARRNRVSPIARPEPIIDPMIIDKQLDRYRKGKRTLELTCAHYGVLLDGAHDATADAIAAGRLAQAISRSYPEQLTISAQELHISQIGWAADQQADFAAYMRRAVNPDWKSDRPTWPGGAGEQ